MPCTPEAARSRTCLPQKRPWGEWIDAEEMKALRLVAAARRLMSFVYGRATSACVTRPFGLRDVAPGDVRKKPYDYRKPGDQEDSVLTKKL